MGVFSAARLFLACCVFCGLWKQRKQRKKYYYLFYCIRNYTAYTHGCPDHKHTQYKKHTHNGEEEDKESIRIRKRKTSHTHTLLWWYKHTHTRQYLLKDMHLSEAQKNNQAHSRNLYKNIQINTLNSKDCPLLSAKTALREFWAQKTTTGANPWKSWVPGKKRLSVFRHEKKWPCKICQ